MTQHRNPGGPPPDPYWDAFNQHELAAYIRDRYRQASGGVLDAHMAMLDVGEALLEAKRQYPRKLAYGGWFKQSGFPFSQQRGTVLRRAAEHRPAVEKELQSQVDAGGNPNMEQALKAIESRLVVNALPRFEKTLGEFFVWARDVNVTKLSPQDVRRIAALREECDEAFGRILGNESTS
jgi:hypothetical protein